MGRFATQRQGRAAAGAWRPRKEDKSRAGLLCRESKAIPRRQRNTQGVPGKDIAHIQHDGGKASGLELPAVFKSRLRI
jgi:hypothetical protein